MPLRSRSPICLAQTGSGAFSENPDTRPWPGRSVGRSPDEPQTVELAGVDVREGSLDPLRRLALGHWLRRWWPASHRDGIAALDAALLDAELALVTAAVQDFFNGDTFDSDVAGLIRPHAVALGSLAREGDPRVAELVRVCSELADDVGVELDADFEAVPAGAGRRDDYALAAGLDLGQRGTAIASGVSSINWTAVPPGIFDAAENTVEWRIEAAGPEAKCVVQVGLSGTGSPAGIAVRLRSGGIVGTGVLDADGGATFPLVDGQQRPMTESAAWDQGWRSTIVTIGVDLDESPQSRERIRDFARARLDSAGQRCVPRRDTGCRIRLLRLVFGLAHGLADLRQPFRGRTLTCVVLLLDGAALR